MLIGGRVCYVKANYLNGKISGHINEGLSAKKHEFEFPPLKVLAKKYLIIAEIKRLYFDFFPPMGKARGPNG